MILWMNCWLRLIRLRMSPEYKDKRFLMKKQFIRNYKKMVQKNKTAAKVLMVVCLLIIIIHAIFIFIQKKGFFLDEACTFQYSNDRLVTVESMIDAYKNGYSGSIATLGYWLSRDDVLDKYTTVENGRFNLLSVYVAQAFDVHPPLYYYVINLVSSLFPRMSLFVVGGIVNIIFLTLTCVMIYLVGMEIFGNSLCSIGAMLYYGLSFDVANCVTFFRMYGILTFWGMLLLYLYIKWYQSGFDLNNSLLGKICLVEFAAMFTQYFAVFYIIPLFAVTVYLMVRNKISVKKYLIKSVITGAVYVVIWPWPFFFSRDLFVRQGIDVKGNLFGGRAIRQILEYTVFVCRSIFGNSSKIMAAILMLVIIVLVIEIFRTVKQKRLEEVLAGRKYNTILYAAVMACFYYVAAGASVSWLADRYIMPVIPVLSVLIVFFVQRLANLLLKNKSVCGMLVIALALFLAVVWHMRLEPYYLYNSPDRLAFVEKSAELDAIIFDNFYDNRFGEVEINFLHPNVLELCRDDATDVKKLVDPDKDYYVYVRNDNDSNKDIEDIFTEMNYHLEKESYETDCYEILHVYN